MVVEEVAASTGEEAGNVDDEWSAAVDAPPLPVAVVGGGGGRRARPFFSTASASRQARRYCFFLWVWWVNCGVSMG